MGIEIGKIGNLADASINGKSVSEAWLNGKLVWPEPYDTVKNVIDNVCVNVGLEPIHYSLFDGDTGNESIRFGDTLWGNSKPFASVSGATNFVEGFEGGRRKALRCAYTTITLDNDARSRVTNAFTLSMCIRQTTSNSGYTGLLGGTIFGLNTKGFGYAIGWGRSIQSNKPAVEVYFGNGACVTYASSSLQTNKWYHVLCRLSKIGGTYNLGLWINNNFTNGTFASGNNISYSNTSALYLGRVKQGGINYFKGDIQDFVLWNEALPDSQIQNIMTYYVQKGI